MENAINKIKEIPAYTDAGQAQNAESLIDGVKWKKKDAARALQTYFRNNYRTHISLSALADRKSHIMIRLNSLLISILIVFFKEIINLTPLAIFTGVIFLVTTLISLIFAALAAKPHVTKNVTTETSFDEAQKNVFFYGNFIGMSLDKYEAVMDSILDSPQLIYDNMIRDIYFLGLVLDKKFKLLNYSYTVFIGGLIATVISFLIAIHTV